MALFLGAGQTCFHGGGDVAAETGVTQLPGGLPDQIISNHADLFQQHRANGIGDLKTQMIFYGAFAALKIPAIMVMKSVFSVPWSFIVVYNCIALLAFCAVQLVWCELKIKKIIKENN